MSEDPDASTETRRASAGLVLGLAAFEAISAVEGIRLTDAMKRDLRHIERRRMSPAERTRFIMDRYGRKPV